MTYLDTGCLVKLYYPESDSAAVAARIRGRSLCFTPIHELELVNALCLKMFFRQATHQQFIAARALIDADTKSGVLVPPDTNWKDIVDESVKLASQHTAGIGCRSLDILHCAAAKLLQADVFISTDARQQKLALAMGLNLVVP